MVEFGWNEDKRLSNLEKHGPDFEDAEAIFDSRRVYVSTSRRDEEVRFVTTSLLLERHVTVIWTWREEKIRIISMRRARDTEERKHHALHG